MSRITRLVTSAESGVSIPYTDHKSRFNNRLQRFLFVSGCVKIVERGELLARDDPKTNDMLMMGVARSIGLIRPSDSKIVDIVASTLFAVHESRAVLSDDDIVNEVSADIGIVAGYIDPIFNQMFEKGYIKSSDYQHDIVFGTNGLWAIEDAFMHGDDSIDSMAVLERNLRQAGFFHEER